MMPDVQNHPAKPTTAPDEKQPVSSLTMTADTSSAHQGDSSEYVPVEVRRAISRKTDLQIIPVVMLMYLFGFLDRVNIGNAKLYGIEEDLGLVGNQYQICVSILFVTYCLFEVPSNLVLKLFRPDRYLSFLCGAWGVVATLTGIVNSYGGLIATRLVMGALEAGLFPGLVIYLTLFYTRDQLAVRIGYLFIASAVAGAVGGMIAYGIGYLDGAAGLSAWRWLMIIEGIPSVLLGVIAYLILPADLETAGFLPAEERVQMRAVKRQEIGQTAAAEEFHWADVLEGVRDWQVWVFSFSGFTNDIIFYGFSTFLPTIIKGLGAWSTVKSQALTVPVYAVGTIIYLLVARFSDKKQLRGIYSAIAGVVACLGYVLLIINQGPAVSYVGTFVVAAGLYVCVGLPLAWLPGNKPRYAKRAFATGLQYMVGNTAGIVMPFLYTTADAPYYYTGYGVSIVSVAVSVAIFCFMSWYYRKVNQRRAEGKEDWRIEGMTEDEIAELGDYSPRYVYST